MPTLANIQGASLVPDLRGTISGVAQAFGQAQERKSKQETALTKQIDTEDALDVLETGTRGQRESALNRLAILQGPAVANSIRATIESGNALQLAQLKLKNDKGLKDTLLIKSFKDPVKRAQAIKSLAAEPGRTPQEIQEMARLMNLPPDQQDIELRKDEIAFTDTKTLVDQNFKRQENRAKLAEFEPVKNEKGEIVAQRNKLTGEIKKNPLAAGGGVAEKGTFTKGTGLVVQNDDGTQSFLTPITDSRSGKTTFQKTAVPGEIISREFGETAQEKSNRLARTAGKKEKATLGARAEGIGAVKKAEVTATGRAGRAQTRITKGIEAGSSLPILKRGIQLLGSVKTGGFNAVRLRAKQLFGVESANEAELSSNVGKAVLQQLRSTFGAAFTENEGNRLQSIEANIGKSTAGNIRLLKQAQKIALDAAKRGLRQARAQGDKESVQEIQDFIDFDLGAGTEKPKAKRKAKGQVGKFTFREK